MNCNNCGKEFIKKSSTNAGRFCSLQCYYSLRKKVSDEIAKDGLTHSQRWYSENKARALQRSKEYAEKHRDTIKIYKRVFYLANQEKYRVAHQMRYYARTDGDIKRALARANLWKKQNKDKVNAGSRRFRKTPQGKARTFYANSRRRMTNIYFNKNVILKWVKSQEVAGDLLCFYCGKSCYGKYEIDHYIPIARGGQNELSNLRIACPLCNRKKSFNLPEVFIRKGHNHGNQNNTDQQDQSRAV